MTSHGVPEGDLTEIMERVVQLAPRDPQETSRYVAARWLNRLFYDVRKWNRAFIDFLKTYPGFRASADQEEYQNFFEALVQYRDSLDSRYGDAKGDLCANLKMLAARFTLDFRWLYESDPQAYDELYGLVRAAYSSEESVLETATGVVNDVVARDEVLYAREVDIAIGAATFLSWHVENHPSVVQTIRDYDRRSAEAVTRLRDIAGAAGVKLLTIEEYDRGLGDPRKHPDVMVMGEIVTERKVVVSNELSHNTTRLNTILAYVFGAIFLGVILTLVVVIPNPTPVQYHFFVVVLALAAGGVATVMTGMIDVRATFGKKLFIGATGALGVFVIVYFFLPAMNAVS